MEIKVVLFGLLEDLFKTKELIVSLVEFDDELNLTIFLKNKYPELEGYSFSIAIGNEIRDVLKKEDGIPIISLFPPFAGG
jgi:hypothetical protein